MQVNRTCQRHLVQETKRDVWIDPYKLIRVGAGEAVQGDPLTAVERELEPIKYVKIPGLPSFTGKHQCI